MTPAYRPQQKIEVALVLSGGGAKGFAHVGAIEALESEGIPIDLIVGTSAGSIVGAFYADYQDSERVYDKLLKLDTWDVIDISMDHTFKSFYEPIAPASGLALENFLYDNLSSQFLEDLAIPFVAVSADLLSEKTVAITSGPIGPAVHASSAAPPVITPVFGYGGILVDGAVTMPVPVEIARQYNPKILISIDISSSEKNTPIYNIYDIANKSLSLMYYTFARTQSQAADVDIHPDLGKFHFFDGTRKIELYDYGYYSTMEFIPKIKKLMRDRGIALKKIK